MHSFDSGEIAGSPAVGAETKKPANRPDDIVVFDGVSKWYGNVIGLNKLSVRIGPGITGLLGPNGAGKSTLLQLATGQLRPSQGTVTVFGQQPWNNPGLNCRIGLCPEQDAFYEQMTGLEFVTFCARLGGIGPRDARHAADWAIEQVGMTANRDRAIRGYSKGMRQRTKLAQALVHNPDVLFLDEPLTGTDPVVRHELVQIISRLAQQGKAIIISSHVLHEVQSITREIVLINRGRLVAEGDLRQIRDLIDKHPHRIVLRSSKRRALAARLVHFEDVVGVELGATDHSILVETKSPDTFYGRLAQVAISDGAPIEEVFSDDDNLEAVFKYLVNP